MVDQNHIIRTQQYQIGMEDQGEAHEFQSRISRLQTNVINELLQRVMDKFSQENYLMQFGEIRLDIGKVNKLNFEKEIANRIEEQLIQYFQTNIFQNGNLKTGRKVKIDLSRIELIERFLLNGYTSWNANYKNSPVLLFKEFILNKEIELIHSLKKHAGKEQVRKRIVFQFDEHTLEGIVTNVVRSESDYIISYKRNIVAYHKENKIIDTDPESFRKAIWEAIMAFIFVERKNYSGKKFFLKYTLENIAKRYRISYASLLHTLSSGINKSNRDIDFKRILVQLQEEELHSSVDFFSSSKFTKKEYSTEELVDYFKKHRSLPFPTGIESKEEFRKMIDLLVNQSKNLSTGYQATINEVLEYLSEIKGYENVLPEKSKKISTDLIQDLLIKCNESKDRTSFLALIEEFSVQHQISPFYVVNELIYLTERIQSSFLPKVNISNVKIFFADWKKERTYKRSVNFSLDLLQYYSIHKSTPWWARQVSKKELSEHLSYAAGYSPVGTIQLLKEIKYRKVLIRLLSDEAYRKLVRYIEPDISVSFFELQYSVVRMIKERFSAFNPKAGKIMTNVRYTILDLLVKRIPISHQELINNFVTIISDEMNISTDIIAKLLYQEVKSNSAISLMVRKQLIQLSTKHVILDRQVFLYEIAKQVYRKNELYQLLSEQSYDNARISESAQHNSIKYLVYLHDEYTDLFRNQLRKDRYRKVIFEKMTIKNTVKFVSLILPVSQQKVFFAAMTILSYLKEEVTAAQYYSVRRHFLNVVMMKISIESHHNWSIRIWVLMLAKSFRKISGSNNTIEIERKINKSGSGNIYVKELLKHLSETKATVVEKKNENVNNRKIGEEELIGLHEDNLFVSGAGVVILFPYLSMLFEKIGLLSKDGFRDEESRMKAIHILSYAVTGNMMVEEQDLMINKILCGMDIETPIDRFIEISDDERNLVDNLLGAVIARWNILKNTSVEGLREAFLQRMGKLTIEEEMFVLKVEQKTYDMLLDQIPWSFNKIKYSWMNKMLIVEWRHK